MCKIHKIVVLFICLLSFNGYSIGINDSKYIELGGSLDPVLVNNVSTKLHLQANQQKYNYVGLVIGRGYCSGTWLGSDQQYSYILTAAHCLYGYHKDQHQGQYVSFKLYDGTIISSGISTNYFNKYTGCSSDIAVAKIPKITDPLDKNGNVIKQPYIDNHFNSDLLLDAINLTGFGIFGSRSLGQLGWLGKRSGTGQLRFLYQDCLINHAIENTPSWAFASPGDSGSAIWQQRKGSDVAVGISSWWFGWQYGYSGHAPIALNSSWLQSIVPMLKTVDDIPTDTKEPIFLLTEKTILETDPLEKNVRGSIYYLKNNNVINGPTRYIWRYPNATTLFSTKLIHQQTNIAYLVWLQGQRKTHCGWGKINNSAWCYPAANLGQLKLHFDQKDNPNLPIGRYSGEFTFSAKSLYNRNYNDTVTINADITINEALPIDGTITAESPFISERFERTIHGTVYYQSPNKIGTNRPQWSRRTGLYSKINVDVKNNQTGAVKSIILRGERYLGCGWSMMNNAAYCRKTGPIYGELRISFIADDNPKLDIGEYKGSFPITVRGLHYRRFKHDLRLNVHLNITE
ncbi:trypsin-like serine protease [Photobacterium kishitanii]|uniref:trypsin-like serine protease n=1 Tax=Photobacterium kishitanii TaxID=318456 RepID=UPI0007F91FD3|nr:trypsin-like serine protease [Photobacterium kishitanii]OBU32128.1 trypsin [Photobacterium kishitanii]PSU23714.1 trypsin [Photobacterium kishitanii]PSW50463.1 trypsin [Photobacterium kishitanii]